MGYIISPAAGAYTTIGQLPKPDSNGVYESIGDARTVAQYLLGQSPTQPRIISEVVETLSASVTISTTPETKEVSPA